MATGSDLPTPEWSRPPARGYTADDLDRLPDLPPHTELLLGSLVFSVRQSAFHSKTVSWLDRQLVDQVPEGWEVWRQMGLKIDSRNRPEPDLMVVDSRADTGPEQTFWLPQDVVLVVEVTEEGEAEWDREVKPRKYAAAEIRYFWRVEYVQGRPIAHIHELSTASAEYVLSGTFRERLTVRRPFPLAIAFDRPHGGREVSVPGTAE